MELDKIGRMLDAIRMDRPELGAFLVFWYSFKELFQPSDCRMGYLDYVLTLSQKRGNNRGK